MSWAVIRQATDEDRARLDRTRRDFINKYALSSDFEYYLEDDPSSTYVYGLFADGTTLPAWELQRFRDMWRKRVRTALRHNSADGIAWGYVGYETRF